MILIWLPLALLATGFLMLAQIRMMRVMVVRFRGGTHQAKDIDYIAATLLAGVVLIHISAAFRL